jgi:hypothetical protein
MLTLQQLVTPLTEDEALAQSLAILQQLGLQTTSWQSGGMQLTTIRLFARVWSKLSATISLVAAGGFPGLAATTSGGSPFLTLLAKYFFSITRLEAQSTIGQILFTSSAGAPVNTWSAGDLIASDSPSGTAGARTYTCTEGGTLGPNATLSVEFKADIAGANGNIAPATTLYLWTPLVGVTPTNPALVPDSNTWVTTPGQDEESDSRLLDRCTGRWSRLGYSNTDGAYKGWALEALPALTRVQIASAPGDGTVTLIGATDLGPIDAGQITTIENFVNGVNDGIGRRPMNDIFDADGAATVTTPALTVTAYCLASLADMDGSFNSTKSAISAALLTFIGKQPIGGVKLQGTQGRILFDDLLETAKTAKKGTRSVTLSISSDVLLSDGQIYLPAITVNVLPVAPGA